MSDVVYLFGGWAPIGRILVVGTVTYVALVAILRISGSRSLASMNAFDFIVSVAIGAVFGRTLTAKDVALAEATTALALLVALQYAVASLQTRWAFFMGIVTSPPTLLYFRGKFLRDALRRQRVTEAEVKAAVRKQQLGSMDAVEAVVLESSGEFSVIQSLGDGSALGETIEEQVRRRTGGAP